VAVTGRLTRRLGPEQEGSRSCLVGSLLGPSGCGKTHDAAAVAGYLTADALRVPSGEAVNAAGEDLAAEPEAEHLLAG